MRGDCMDPCGERCSGNGACDVELRCGLSDREPLSGERVPISDRKRLLLRLSVGVVVEIRAWFSFSLSCAGLNAPLLIYCRGSCRRRSVSALFWSGKLGGDKVGTSVRMMNNRRPGIGLQGSTARSREVPDSDNVLCCLNSFQTLCSLDSRSFGTRLTLALAFIILGFDPLLTFSRRSHHHRPWQDANRAAS